MKARTLAPLAVIVATFVVIAIAFFASARTGFASNALTCIVDAVSHHVINPLVAAVESASA